MREVKEAKCGKDFLDHARPFVVNMTGNKKTLHIKGCQRCPYSKFLYKYLDFDTLEEAESFPLAFSKCQRCFPTQ